MAFIRKYDSWSDYMDQVNMPANYIHCMGSSQKRSDGPKPWSGTATYAEAQELAVNGWDGIRLEIEQLTDAITDDLKDSLLDTFRERWDVAGQTVDIGRYMSGEPENMVSVIPMQVSRVGRVVTILVNSFYSSSVSTMDIQRRGVAICGLVECLNLMQHETEIWNEITVGGKGGPHTTLIKLKSAGEPLDIGRLMFAIAHPSAFRRIWFKYAETLPANEQRCIDDHYGYPADCQCADEIEPNINLPILKHGFSDAVEWVRSELLKFGLLAE